MRQPAGWTWSVAPCRGFPSARAIDKFQFHGHALYGVAGHSQSLRPFSSSSRRHPPARRASGPVQLPVEHPCPAGQAGLSALRRTTRPGSRARRLSASVSGAADPREGFRSLQISPKFPSTLAGYGCMRITSHFSQWSGSIVEPTSPLSAQRVCSKREGQVSCPDVLTVFRPATGALSQDARIAADDRPPR